MRDEATDLKDIAIKNLQEENQNLHTKCKEMERKIMKLETSHNSLTQHRRPNNIVLVQ